MSTSIVSVTRMDGLAEHEIIMVVVPWAAGAEVWIASELSAAQEAQLMPAAERAAERTAQ